MKFWKCIDILNKDDLSDVIQSFNPTHVLHLAAKANLHGKSIDDFPENVAGTRNMIFSSDKNQTVKRFIHISTQFVCRPGVYPNSDDEYSPYTAYGLSKAESEKIIKSFNPNFEWVILRPTNIWGPWHPGYPYEMWPYLKKRYYMHPGYSKIVKHYGFVKNVCYQMNQFLFHLNKDDISKKVFYITDSKIDSSEWMNAFSLALSGKKIKKIPRIIWFFLASIGSLLQVFNIKFPVDLGRYFRTTVNENLPVDKTFNLISQQNNISLFDGVEQTVIWLKNNVDEFKNLNS